MTTSRGAAGSGRTAILHIGIEKTGSTSIQSALFAQRQALAAGGVWYARVPADREHHGLAAFARQPGGAHGIWGARAAGVDLRGAIAAELAALPATIHSVVYSTELLNSRLVTPAAVGRLQALFAPHFAEFRVVVYLRRQDRRAVSGYSTRLRHGRAEPDLLPDDPEWLARLDYAALLDRWAAVFGNAAIVPRRFDAVTRDGGDVVRDFWAAAALPGQPPAAETRRNTALNAAAQEFLRRHNAAAAAAGYARDAVQRLDRELAPALAAFVGGGQRPDRAAARSYFERFTATNAQLRDRWFPELQAVFDAAFEDYPEATTAPAESAIAAVATEVALRLAIRAAAHSAAAKQRGTLDKAKREPLS